jgi:hydroxylamine dehydrogenase
MYVYRFVLMILVSACLISAAENNSAGRCMVCHKEKTRGLYNQWFNSSHAMHNVTCIDCHRAKKNEKDAFLHYDSYIATLVTPKDCGTCHPAEMKEVSGSHHARAGQILESNDAYLAHVAAGHPVAIQGCESCHGANIVIDSKAENKLAKTTWPNSGIGRINPDGSLGSCNACHTRHAFSRAQARQPESCSKCHLGPDHPQKEVYEESKHGNAYYTNIGQMNLAADPWVVGEDYFAAPTCASCHMSATSKQRYNHNVGRRISWTCRPLFSTKTENWVEKRNNMKDVCRTCHGDVFVAGHYYQYDATIRLYNEKFAEPANRIMTLVRQQNLLEKPAHFANQIEWTFWELWHHEGRRARHGSAMMGPDYTWWHGFYKVAKHFYLKFIPEAQSFRNETVNSVIDSLFTHDPMHQWINQETGKLRRNIRNGSFEELYKQMFEQ